MQWFIKTPVKEVLSLCCQMQKVANFYKKPDLIFILSKEKLIEKKSPDKDGLALFRFDEI
jgi:predicted ABC-type exoprotein transport system permease subunit